MLEILTTFLNACSCAPPTDEENLRKLKAVVNQSSQQQSIMRQRRLLEEQTRLDQEAIQQQALAENRRRHNQLSIYSFQLNPGNFGLA